MQNRLAACCSIWLALVLLSACAGRLPPPQHVVGAECSAYQAPLADIAHWRVQGRVAVRTEDEAWNAHFDWRQDDRHFLIRLRGPFGQGAVELYGDAQGVRLKRPDQSVTFAPDPEQLLLKETGWRLPVTGLTSWLRGVPINGGEQVMACTSDGRIVELEQAGWRISYPKYQQLDSMFLPKVLQLEREDLSVKFVLDDWEFS